MFTANLERFKFKPYGLEGGERGREGRLYLIRDGVWKPLPSKVSNLGLMAGDIIRLETSGGGGYGAATDRSSEAIDGDRICHHA
ncbi:MAG TPA: hydantoinase B/oxoprolinase family protein [Paenirhodobacter sp.]